MPFVQAKQAEFQHQALKHQEFPALGKAAVSATKQLINPNDLALAIARRGGGLLRGRDISSPVLVRVDGQEKAAALAYTGKTRMHPALCINISMAAALVCGLPTGSTESRKFRRA